MTESTSETTPVSTETTSTTCIDTTSEEVTTTETSTTKDIEEPVTKKAKMGTTTTKSTEPTTIAVEAPDNEWPEAWLMDEEGDDQKKPNKLSPNVPVDAAALREIGIR